MGNFGDIVSQGISWDKNALVGHSGGYSLKRLGKKATLDLFYSLCYTVITHSPKSHILSLGNSYKKRAPCSEHAIDSKSSDEQQQQIMAIAPKDVITHPKIEEQRPEPQDIKKLQFVHILEIITQEVK